MTKRNRSTRYGCQRARGLRPSCHPRSRAASFVVCGALRAADARSRAATCALLTRAHARRPACVAPTRALLTRAHAPRIQRRAIDSRPLTRCAFHPTQDAGPKGRVARGAKPSCSLTRRPALSVARGMRNTMGVSVSRRESGRNQYAGDEAQPIDAVRMSESTRASPLVPPALTRGILRGLQRLARGWRALTRGVLLGSRRIARC